MSKLDDINIDDINVDLIAMVVSMSYTEAVKDSVRVLHDKYDEKNLMDNDSSRYLLARCITDVSKLTDKATIENVTKNIKSCLRV